MLFVLLLCSVSPDASQNSSKPVVTVPLSSERYLLRRATTVFHEDFSSGQIRPDKWTYDVKADGMHVCIY